MIIELKPCPICGKSPVAFNERNRSFIKCESCGCLVAADDTLERTAAIWNGYKEQKTYAQDFLEKFPFDKFPEAKKPPFVCRYYFYGKPESGELECFDFENCEKCWNEVMKWD